MWHGLDFSKLNITFRIGNAEFRLVEAKRTLFYENFPNHMHSFFELHYICGGEGILVLSEENYPLSDGTIFLVPPKTFHEQRTHWQNLMEEYSFSFDVKKIKGGEAEDWYGKLSEQEFWLSEKKQVFAEYFRALEEEAKEKSLGCRDMIQSLLKQLTVQLLRQMYSSRISAARDESVAEERRKFIIDETMIYQYRDITLEKLAEYLNLSTRQTARVLKEEYGMGFLELRSRSRGNAAAALLRRTDTPVSEVAELAGYETPIYFTKQFKQLFGCTPASYRKKEQKKRRMIYETSVKQESQA